MYPSHSLIPQVLLFEFFFLYALERQITKSKNHQQYMPSPAGPASAFMVIQTQFLLQLLVAQLKNQDPTQAQDTNQMVQQMTSFAHPTVLSWEDVVVNDVVEESLQMVRFSRDWLASALAASFGADFWSAEIFGATM